MKANLPSSDPSIIANDSGKRRVDLFVNGSGGAGGVKQVHISKLVSALKYISEVFD